MTPGRNRFLLLLSIFCLNFIFSGTSVAQNQNAEEIEVYLDFKHRSVIRTVVIAYFREGEVFLPINELFDLLLIDHQIDASSNVVFGKYLSNQTEYQLNFTKNIARFGKDESELTVDDYIITELDYYLKEDLFNNIFGLDFTVDLNNLALTLISSETLPIVAKVSRQKKRELILGRRNTTVKDYAVQFDRERKILNGGFVDYNISGINNENGNLLNYTTSLGLEVLGGDLQGTVNGSQSADNSLIFTQNFRWRQVFDNNLYLTRATIGQTSSTGLLMTPFTGIQVSNTPIEPRRFFDEYQVAGNTEPQSEVEIYLNNSLVDFQTADAVGNYRFLVPLTYGASQYDLRIFEPTGRIRNITRRLQIPFTFIPEGEVNYNVNVGVLDDPLIGTADRGLIAQTDVNAGVTDWLTAKVGVEYFENFNTSLPTFTAGISSRISDLYLFSAEIANNAFFRTNFNVIYPNASSITLSFTEYLTDNGIYNITRTQREYAANLFYPLVIADRPINLRVFTSKRFREFSNPITRYRFDLNTRLDRFNFRFGFSDTQVDDIFFSASNQSKVFASTTYTISRARTVPAFWRGFFFRGQVGYFTKLKKMEQVEILASKNITKTGRIQFVGGRNFLGNFNSFAGSLVFDFYTTRTNSSFRSIRQNYNITQNIRGSIGYDPENKNVIVSSRDQVGKSGLAVRLYVDDNNSGSFDENDTIIEDNALRLDRSGFAAINKSGIQYYTQIQSYFKYNVDINKAAIMNPLLVPQLDEIGIITDPNRFKVLDIPFYSSGVIEGLVERNFEGARKGIGGLKLIIEGVDESDDFVKEIRTFSDGSFYDYEIPPGKYEIKVDESQLEILNVVPSVDKIEFEVEALAEGDFIEGLYIELLPKGVRPDSLRDNLGIGLSDVSPTPTTTPSVDASGTSMSIEYLEANNCTYRLQVGAFLSKESAELVASMHQQINPKLIYNKARDLFAVRGGYFQTMSSSTREARFVRSYEFPDVAVVNKCYDGIPQSIYRGDYVYILQFGAYAKASQAQALASKLNEQYKLGAFMLQDNDRLFKVRLGPFEDIEAARKKKTEVIDNTYLNEVYLTKAAMTTAPQIDVEFDYIIQLGEFPNTETAQQYADKLQADFGIRCRIMVDEEETIQLIVDKSYMDWDEVQSIRSKIGGTSGYIVPIIQLVERPVGR